MTDGHDFRRMLVRLHLSRCGCGTLTCQIDGLLHRLHLTNKRLCDRHDRWILGD